MRLARFLFVVVFSLGIFNVSLRAQTPTSAAVLGTVRDSTGAVIAGAEVTLRDTATNATHDQVTGSEGQYAFPNVAPGAYVISVKKEGFQTATISDLKFSATKSYTIDVPLSLGTTTETVSVTAEATIELQTTNATLGDVIGGQELMRLPTLTRDASELLSLQPGATPNSTSGDTFSSNGGTVSGARADQNSVTLDGLDITFNMSPGGGEMNIIPINVETISEFRVGVSNPNSSFGGSAGGQIPVESKGGTNTFHGDVYWYMQNTVLNANSWDNNRLGLPRPAIRDNRGGFSVGGPIRKNQTFFFVNYEPRRFFQSIQEERLVPSNTLKGLNPAYPAGALSFGGTTYSLPSIDPRGIGLSPTVKALWAQMPTGNDLSVADDPTSPNYLGYKFNAPAPLTEDSASLRLDHNFNTNLHFFGRYANYRNLNPRGGGLDQVSLIGASGGNAKFAAADHFFGDAITAGLDWTISNNLINSVHFGRVRGRLNYDAMKGSSIASQLNLPGANSADGPAFLAAAYFGAPFGSLLGVPVDFGGIQTRRAKAYTSTIEVRDDLTWIKNTHTIGLGVDARWLPAYYEADNRLQGAANSVIATLDAGVNALSIPSSDVPSAVPQAAVQNWDRVYAAALGLVDNTAILAVRNGNFSPLPLGSPVVLDTRSFAPFFYLQDSWRIKPSLTLTYGISYGWQTPPSESQGRFSVLTDAGGKPIDPVSYLNSRKAAAEAGQIYNPPLAYVPYKKLGMAGQWHTDYTDLAPRVSIAWSPTSKTVIRAGYAMVYDRYSLANLAPSSQDGGITQGLTLNTPFCNATGAGGTNCNAAAADPVVSTFRVGIDGTIPVPPADTAQPTPYIPQPGSDFWLFMTDPNFKNGREHMFDLTIQRELPGNMLMEVGYVGRLGRRLATEVTLSQAPYMFKDVTTVTGGTGSGQTFAQAFDAVATALRAGNAPTNQPWFENQLPAGFGNGCGTGGANLSNTACLATSQSSNFTQGGVTALFLFAMDPARAAAGYPRFINPQQADLGFRWSHDISNYHGAFVTLRSRGWHGLTFGSTYTFSKSLDQEGRVQVFTNGYYNSFNPHASYGPSYSDRTHVFNTWFSYELPFGKQGKLSSNITAVNRIIGGWYLTGVFRAMSGVPLVAAQSPLTLGGGIVTSNNVAEIPTKSPASFGGGLHSGVTGSAAPCLGPGQTAGSGSTATGLNYFADPGAAFCSFRPILLASDTTTGRGNPLRGFGSWNQDLTIGKETSITERVKMQLSADIFNLFNNVTFNDPGVGGSAGFMDITNPSAFGVISSQFIPGNRLSGARWIQLGLRFGF